MCNKKLNLSISGMITNASAQTQQENIEEE
jgi:hypothetical protein